MISSIRLPFIKPAKNRLGQSPMQEQRDRLQAGPAHPEQFAQTPSICLATLTEELVNRVTKNRSLIRNPASRSRSTTRARVASRGKSLAQPTMNSSALGSRSLSRNGEGSMALNNCFNSPTCTSMTEHLGGSGSPAEGCHWSRWACHRPRIRHATRRL